MKNNLSDLLISKEPLVMGILNVTPDSFSDGGKFLNIDEAVKEALVMIEEGASIIDIGGESTRPGSEKVSVSEELKRVVPIFEAMEQLNNKDLILSIDTTKAEVARKCLERGAVIVNDISAMNMDKEMASVVKEFNAYVVLMHMRGEPETMQDDTDYGDIVQEVKDFFKERIDFATSKGIKKEKIILDVGIGFGKSLEGNLELIKRQDEFLDLNCPMLMGASRKSFIGKILDSDGSNTNDSKANDAKDRLEGSLAVANYSFLKGAKIFRVHDVKETKRSLKTIEAIEG